MRMPERRQLFIRTDCLCATISIASRNGNMGNFDEVCAKRVERKNDAAAVAIAHVTIFILLQF